MIERARAESDGDAAVPVCALHANRDWRRHLAVAAALVLLVGGVVGVAIGMSRSDDRAGVIAPSPSEVTSTTAPISPTTVPSTTLARTRIAVDESVPTHLASALRAVPIEAARDFLARRPLILPWPEHLPRPENADDLEYAEATDFGDRAQSTSIDYFRWTEAGPVSAMWLGLNATYDTALPAIPDDVMAQVVFGDGVAYVSNDLTAECDQEPVDALNPTALLWQHQGAVHQLEVQPIPECSDTFTWADVRAIVGALLTCWEDDGIALCAPADLPPLPEDSRVKSRPTSAPTSDHRPHLRRPPHGLTRGNARRRPYDPLRPRSRTLRADPEPPDLPARARLPGDQSCAVCAAASRRAASASSTVSPLSSPYRVELI